MTRAIALALAAVVLGGFGGTASQATLRVTLVDRMQARPVEGYVWFVGLDGKAHPVANHTTTILRASAGRHLLTSYIRNVRRQLRLPGSTVASLQCTHSAARAGDRPPARHGLPHHRRLTA